MSARKTSNAGFTLSELLLAVAIIGILAAIAIPSIVSAQNNMRMVELNNAAESIANAAQAQMTAKKVSGTWIDLVKDGEAFRSDYPQARTQDEASNRRYMTADTARANGVVPSLSIDDAVRDGDYVIEFDASTASVISVFYTDGKSGFFGKADPSTQAARSYYASGGSTDQQARMKNPIMIGYYEGTPAGATPEAALANPVIWVDAKTGCLMVQDPNIAKGTGTTTSTVTIVNTSKNVSFVLSSLSNRTTLMSVATVDGGVTYALSGTVLSRVLNQVDRDGAESTQANVFSLDLNALSSAIPSSGYDALKAVFAQCSSGDRLTVDVETKDTAKNCVPATASANIEWPAPVGKLTFMITNPYSSVVAEGQTKGSGAADPAKYIAPKVSVTTPDGTESEVIKPTQVAEDADNYIATTSTELAKQNAQAKYQSYLGGWVSASDVINDDTFRFKATVGSYQGSQDVHVYQINELWLKLSSVRTGELTRIGYLEQGKWVWAQFTQDNIRYDYAGLRECFVWYDKAGNVVDVTTEGTESVVSVAFNAQQYYLFAKAHPEYGLVTDDDATTIYARTAPRVSEVQSYFTDLAESGQLASTYLTSNAEQSASRTVWAASNKARERFEAEFGASSSDVAWSVTKDTTTAGFNEGKDYLNTIEASVRVYYALSPGLGFSNIRTAGNNLAGLRSTTIVGASLWYFRGASLEGALTAMPAATLVPDANDRFTFEDPNGSNCDFRFRFTRDYQFYRVLTYVDEEGNDVGTSSRQYVPHVAASDPNVATIAPGYSYTDGDRSYTFSHWKTTDASGQELRIDAGKLVSDYPALPTKGVTLTAVYEELPKGAGLLYLEFDENNTTSGYAGYLGAESEWVSNLTPNDTTIESWGYYVVVPDTVGDNDKKPTFTGSGNSYVSLDSEYESVVIGGSSYRAYKIINASKEKALKERAIEIELKYGEGQDRIESEFYINLNFAAAVANDDDIAKSWGETEENPWIVRHANQFPGVLKFGDKGIDNSIVSVYSSDCFLQSHDIDMSQAGLNTKIKNVMFKDTVFSGIYDGGNYLIKNTRFNSIALDKVDPKTGDKGYRGCSLLFPRTCGFGEKIAILKNIKIQEVFSQSGDNLYEAIVPQGNVDYKTYFGMLAGSIEKTLVENCSVTSVIDGSLASGSIRVSHQLNSVYGWGVLIGFAVDSSLDSLAVSRIQLTSKNNSTNSAWDSTVSTGCIVGHAIDTTIDKCSVENAAVGTTLSNKKKELNAYAGSIVGLYEGSGKLTNCTVNSADAGNNVVLVVGEERGVSERRPEVGALVGNAAGQKLIGDGCSARNVFVQQGDKTVPIEQFSNLLQVDPAVSARKEETAAEPEAAAAPVEPTNEAPTTQEPASTDAPAPSVEDAKQEDPSSTNSSEKVDPHA